VSEPTQVSNAMYYFLPREIEGFSSVAELALDMRWSWNRYGDDVWQRLDPDLWELTHNPWVVLQTASRGRPQRVSCLRRVVCHTEACKIPGGTFVGRRRCGRICRRRRLRLESAIGWSEGRLRRWCA